MEPLGSAVLLEEVCHSGVSFEILQPGSTSCSPSASCVWMKCDQLASCSNHHAFPDCCQPSLPWWTPSLWNHKHQETLSPISCFCCDVLPQQQKVTNKKLISIFCKYSYLATAQNWCLRNPADTIKLYHNRIFYF